jgi:hypothetical protein
MPNIASWFAGPMQASRQRHSTGVVHQPNAAFPCATGRVVSSNTEASEGKEASSGLWTLFLVWLIISSYKISPQI